MPQPCPIMSATEWTFGTILVMDTGYARVSTAKQDLDRQIDAPYGLHQFLAMATAVRLAQFLRLDQHAVPLVLFVITHLLGMRDMITCPCDIKPDVHATQR